MYTKAGVIQPKLLFVHLSKSCSKLVNYICVITMVTSCSGILQAESQFDQWIREFWPQAESAGVSAELYDRAFKNLEPDPEVLRLASYQPEFVTPIWDYIEKRVSEFRIDNGKQRLIDWNGTLGQIEEKYGVDKNIVVAIWGIESAYGEVLNNPKIVRNNIRSLATLAYGDPKRSSYAKRQLIAALKIVQSGEIKLEELKGSWAGAMGHTQFIPTTYQEFAVDFDGDGKRNIWTSIPDALASTASYLNQSGWESGKTWGYEVDLPREFDYMLADERSSMSLAEWSKMGVQRISNLSFPRLNDKANLFLPAGASGPAFLLLKNFDVIKRYNNSNAYALAVGHLADRLRGGGSFHQPWSKVGRPLTVNEIKKLQTELIRLGYDAGPIDGKSGPITRQAIREYQLSIGLVPDGQPDSELLKKIN